MKQYSLPEQLYEEWMDELDVSNIKNTCERFSKLRRVSGSADGEAASDYLYQQMTSYGIRADKLSFTGYLSSAVDAHLRITAPVEKEIDTVVCGFSATAECEGELAYDAPSVQDGPAHTNEVNRFSSMAGKILLTRQEAGEVALEAGAAGVLAVISIYPSNDPVPHYLGTSTIWGTPTPDKRHLLHNMPCINITKADGEYLLELMQSGPVHVKLKAAARNGATTATLPIGYIPGAEENFVLLTGHYDSHCVGMTDNGAGDAVILELARLLQAKQHLLKRGVMVCFWAGHEYGQYAGSCWFSDDRWQQLRQCCVGHVNIDVAGCSGATQIRARTTRMEGKDFTDELIRAYTGNEPLPYIPLPHVGEQSFLGRQVPVTIMLKYEAPEAQCDFWGAGGGYWWHSRDDTLDKVDYAIAERDLKINARMLSRLLNSEHLPVRMNDFLAESERLLQDIDANLSPDFDLSPVYPVLERLKAAVARLETELPARSGTDDIIKRVAGELIRLQFTYSPAHEYDRLGVPSNFQKFRQAQGLNRENTGVDEYLFVQTDFVRQRNRLIGGYEQIIEAIEYQLLRWAWKDREHPRAL